MSFAFDGDFAPRGYRGGISYAVQTRGDPFPFFVDEIERNVRRGIMRHSNPDFAFDRIGAHGNAFGAAVAVDTHRNALSFDLNFGIREAVRQYGSQAVQHAVPI